MRIRLSSMWILAFAFSILVSWINVAHAQSASVSIRWTAPTAHTDGSAITASLTYNVYSGAKGAPKTKLGSTTAGATTFTASTTIGSCFAVTAVESGVGESAQSDELCTSAPPNKPTGVTLVTVTISQ